MVKQKVIITAPSKVKEFNMPYNKYLKLDYEKLSEKEMMTTLYKVFNIDPNIKNGLFNEKSHYTIVGYIMMASLKLKYKIVCSTFRKIYPLSFPMWEKSYPKNPFENKKKIESISNIAPPMMIEMPLEEQNKRLKGVDFDSMTKMIREKEEKKLTIHKLVCCNDGINECDFCNTPTGCTFIILSYISKSKIAEYQFYICKKCAVNKK